MDSARGRFVRWAAWHVYLGCFSLLAALAACAIRVPPTFPGSGSAVEATLTPLPPLPTLDTERVQMGREIYQANCATCHGADAEGAPNWATPGPDGLYPPPPHDDRGHTWHHSDRVLYEAIQDGMSDPLRPASPLRMPAFNGILSDAEVRAVVEYFKSLWTEEHRLWQWEQTLNDFAPTPTPP